MFIGQKSCWATQKHYLPIALAAAFEEVLSLDLTKMEAGRYDLTLVAGAFFLLQDVSTKKFEATRPEAHRDFIDIQYLVKGVERFGYAQAEAGLKPVEEMFDEKDLAFYPAPRFESFVDLQEGQFLVFYAGELHRPMCCVDAEVAIRKIVVKVPVKALG